MANARTHLDAANAAVGDRFLNSVDMKVGAYTLDETTLGIEGASHVTLTHTSVGTTDTLGTVTIVGKLFGETITEVLTPSADGTVTSTKWFSSLVSATGAGWVIDAVEGTKDTIVIGYSADLIVAHGTGVLHSVVVNTTAAGTITLADASGTIAVIAASITEDNYVYDVIFYGYLSVVLGAASDVTILHSGSLPTTYAMS